MSDPAEPYPPQDMSMEVHKPKPIHNWREFLKEYAIIVIGVLTALGAEQGAEWWHWSRQYEQARGSLATELANNAARGAYRLAHFNCTEARLDRAAAILDEASRTGVLPQVGNIGFSLPFDWPSGAWDSVVGAQVAPYFPREQLAGLGLLYQQIRRENEFDRQEQLVGAELNAMVGPGRRFDPVLDAALHAALSKARMLNSQIAMAGGIIERRTFALDLPFSEADRKAVSDRIAQGHICRPQGTFVPDRYGTSLYPDVRPAIQERLKYRPYTDKARP
jgi:hypothetical protein